MAKLKDKVQTGLDEARMLILGSQVLLGFQFRSAFEPGFERLPEYARLMKFGGLCLMVIAIGLLMWPGAFHQVAEQGEDTPRMHRFTSGVMEVALLPFAFGFGIDMFVAGDKLMGLTAGIISGLAGTLVALFFWYGLGAISKDKYAPQIREIREMEKQDGGSEQSGTKLKDKIKHVLTEARVVLPGAQALLGFQFATFLMDGFDKLPESSKYIHFASLALVGLSITLLMTPAAYHRIVEKGEETEHFHRFSGRMLLSAMVPLALGIAGDLFVVARKITESAAFAAAASMTMIAIFFGLWFGYTAYRSGRRNGMGHGTATQKAA
jgi:hypothetical protein